MWVAALGIAFYVIVVTYVMTIIMNKVRSNVIPMEFEFNQMPIIETFSILTFM